MRNEKRYDVFILWKSLRYKWISAADEGIMALKICVAVTVFR